MTMTRREVVASLALLGELIASAEVSAQTPQSSATSPAQSPLFKQDLPGVVLGLEVTQERRTT